MRRSEREITQRDKLLELLDKCRVMHLGLTDGAAPYVVPLHYGWEEREGGIALYFHSAPEGRKMDCIRKHPACFIAVTGDTRVIGSEEAHRPARGAFDHAGRGPHAIFRHAFA